MATRVLLTGADGFIGSHLAELLVERGYRVRALVFYNSFDSRGWLDHVDPRIVAAMEVMPADIRDPHGMRTAARDCDAILHLAALIGIPYSYHSPDNYLDTNIRGTLNLLQAARELGVRRLVHTSTSEVYGTAQAVPITEEHRLRAQSPYAATKIAADQLALSFHASFGTPVVVLRPFNTFGPRQSTRAVIPTTITQIAAGATEISLGALTPTRDFTYVRDTARAFLAALEAPDVEGEVINAGSGFEISIGDTVALIARLMGRDVRVTTDARRVRPASSEVERLFACNRKAQRLLGWTPERPGIDGFELGLERTVAWFRNPANLARYRAGNYTL